MKIALAQINQKIGDFNNNIKKIIDTTAKARQDGADLVVFSELAVSGYPPLDLLDRPAFVDDSEEALEVLVKEIRGIAILVGCVTRNPLPQGKSLLNSVVFIQDGKIIAQGGKRLLPSYDVFDETRYFEATTSSLMVNLHGEKLGVTICEDIWSDEDISPHPLYSLDPVADLNKEGMDLLINISASPYYFGKQTIREEILKHITTEYKVPAIYVNQVGGNDELLFDGGSMVFNAGGELQARASQFKEDLIIWDSIQRQPGEIRPLPASEEEEVFESLVMGTRDYLAKCGFEKAVLNLSGGVDSALVACIAAKALGPDRVTTLFMPSPYSSDMSAEDSKKLAKNLGVQYIKVPINTIFTSYLDELKPVFKGLPVDEAEENIQARIRGNLLMAYSNKFNALPLSTGNKSELAVGYCTLYGDMSGGLAVISDVLKIWCYRLCWYINRDKEIIPERILTRAPTAELKPDQTDQDSLPPYPTLDGILTAYIEEHLSLNEVVEKGYDRDLVIGVLKRVENNEYKRLQAPPGLKVTKKAFGLGRRYPIARAGGAGMVIKKRVSG
ncbi:MAG: NAD+ synthase [Deltaproteobacteria bacterium]|nr:NAD+ synthase [Deltaproteobacteria bacterium]